MQFDATDLLKALAALPPEPVKLTPEPKTSAWTAPLRAIPAAVAEVGAAVVKLGTAAPEGSSASGGRTEQIGQEVERSLRNVAESYAPDPETAGKAEQIIFGLTRGVGKAVGYGLTTGPAAPFLFGVDEGLTEREKLIRQGVDEKTATEVGMVTGAVNAAGFLIPVAGKTAMQTAGLATLSGPASFVAQQSASRSILANADYDAIAQTYDPTDAWGLGLSMVPFGFGAWAMRGRMRGAKPAEPKAPDVVPMEQGARAEEPPIPVEPVATSGVSPDIPARSPDVVPASPEVAPRVMPQEYVDAAMVQNLTDFAEAAKLEAEAIATPRQTAERAAAEFLQGKSFDRWLETADYSNGLGAVADALGIKRKPGTSSSKTVEMVRGAIGVKPVAGAIPDRFIETRGTGVRLHGSGRAIAALSDEYAMAGDNRNIYGQGFYTTDAADVAFGYMKKGGKDSALYEVTQKDVKLFDMEQPVSPDVEAILRTAMGDNFPAENAETGAKLANVREVFDEYRRESVNNGLSRDEVQGTFDAIRTTLEGMGFRGYEHLGGGITGAKGHNVRIFWVPEQDVQIKPVSISKFEKEPAANVPPPQELGTQAREAPKPEGQAQGKAAEGQADPALMQSVRTRADEVATTAPDLVVGLAEDGSPITAKDALERIRREAQNGTDDELGAIDAPLVKIAMECALRFGE
jgi:hypothetical protein